MSRFDSKPLPSWRAHQTDFEDAWRRYLSVGSAPFTGFTGLKNRGNPAAPRRSNEGRNSLITALVTGTVSPQFHVCNAPNIIRQSAAETLVS